MLRFSARGKDNRPSPVKIAKTPLGSGADANIYLIDGHPDMVAKIYHDAAKDPQRPDKIRAMLANPPDMPPIREGRSSYIQIAWPTGMIEDSRGHFAGYAMPLVDLKCSTILENVLAGKTRRILKLPEFYGYRVVAAANLAAVVGALHACGHHIIDLKPVNLNVYTDKFYIALLDCDGLSIQATNGRRFEAHQYTDGYIAPEALQGQMRPQQLGEGQDRFALAVIVFQLLNSGIHPYQGVPRKGSNVPPTNSERIQRNLYAYGKRPNPLLRPSPWSIHTFLEDDTRDLFDRAFCGSAHQRPSAAEWKRHLQKLADPATGLLKKCPRNSGHGMFTRGCGFCHVEGAVKIKAGGPSKRRPSKKRSPRHTAAARQPFPQRRAPRPAAAGPPMALWKRIVLMAAATGLIGMILLVPYLIRYMDIHSVIARNDQKTFFKRAESSGIDWAELTMEDARTAVSFEDQRLFDTIIENMPQVSYDSDVLNTLMVNKRFESLKLYVQQVEKFPASRAVMRSITSLGVPELIKNYRDKIERVDELYSQVFLEPDIDDVREILGWGADPNMLLENEDYFAMLYKHEAYCPNPIDPAVCTENSHPLSSLCRRYAGPFKAPGAAKVADIRRTSNALKFSLAAHAPPRSFFGRRLRMSPHVHPLTVAVLKGHLEVTRALIAAGADANNVIPNHESIFDMAPTADFYRALKSGWKPANASEEAIMEDKPEKLAAALDHAAKKGPPPNRKTLRLLATRAGSVRCFNLLLHRWKGSHGMNSLEAIFNAYRSHNPLMLIYYLKHILPYNRSYTYEQIRKASPHKEKRWIFFRYDVISELADQKNREIEIGDCLLGMARQDKSWAMAFVLDDYRSKWSDLHMAVLSEDTEKIRNLLQAAPGRIEEKDAIGRTPLGLAAEYECGHSLDVLMTFNPELGAGDKNGYTPLMHAVSNGNAAMVEYLLKESTGGNSAAGSDCATIMRISEKNEEIANHLEQTVSTYWLGGVPTALFDSINNIHRTRSLIQTTCGTP